MIARTAIVALAAIAALAPLPRTWVEQAYSSTFYLSLQQRVTAMTNAVPVAVVDIAGAVLLGAAILLSIVRIRRAGLARAALRGVVVLATWGAVLYLWFLGMWGLNYRRVPLEQKLRYDAARVTPDAAVSFASIAVAAVNRGYAPAHASEARDDALAAGFADAQRLLGASQSAVPGVPKPSLLPIYFRRAAIDGMTDPFFLEVIINPDVLPSERPFVLAHEWAHLAGYADESEANFVAWLTCLRGDAAARYSGWLAVYQHAVAAVPRARRTNLPTLDPGPQSDLERMAERYARTSPIVRHAAQRVYDRYLRANRVSEGIASYDVVVRLLLGTSFDREWTPRLR